MLNLLARSNAYTISNCPSEIYVSLIGRKLSIKSFFDILLILRSKAPKDDKMLILKWLKAKRLRNTVQ